MSPDFIIIIIIIVVLYNITLLHLFSMNFYKVIKSNKTVMPSKTLVLIDKLIFLNLRLSVFRSLYFPWEQNKHKR